MSLDETRKPNEPLPESAELTLEDKDDSQEISNHEEEEDDERLIGVPASDQVRKRGVKGSWSAESAAESIYDKNLSSCSWVEPSKVEDMAHFDPTEVMVGSMLGSGCFGSVWEVKGFHLRDVVGEVIGSRKFRLRKPKKELKAPEDVEVNPDEVESRNFIARHCCRNNGDARYALKRLKPSTLEDEEGFVHGMNDLATETLFLSCLRNHPNVIKLRGVAVASMFSRDYFLILDRLYDTLKVRIQKWKRKRKGANVGLAGPVFKDRRRSIKNQILEEQMRYGMDLMAAIAYIHDHRIMHRDLKPDNIGFDVRDDIKVFDFGLAKELPPAETDSMDETYRLTAAGTPRYAAPEVGMGKPYNQACDIYSFALIFWEMLSMQRAHPKQVTIALLEDNVWNPDGPELRPEFPQKLPLNVCRILNQAWNGDHKMRPKAEKLLNSLRKECLKIRQSMRVSHNARRSTFVLGRDGSSKENTMKSMRSLVREGSSKSYTKKSLRSLPSLRSLTGSSKAVSRNREMDFFEDSDNYDSGLF